MANEVIPEPLRRRYIDSFPAKCSALEAAIDGLDNEDEGPPVLRDLAHKLAGSAGMYGFDDLGQLARELVHSIDAGAGPAILRGLTAELTARLATTRTALGV